VRAEVDPTPRPPPFRGRFFMNKGERPYNLKS
jgi:hypothetical protein